MRGQQIVAAPGAAQFAAILIAWGIGAAIPFEWATVKPSEQGVARDTCLLPLGVARAIHLRRVIPCHTDAPPVLNKANHHCVTVIDAGIPSGTT